MHCVSCLFIWLLKGSVWSNWMCNGISCGGKFSTVLLKQLHPPTHTHTHNEEHWGSSPTGVLSLSVVYGFKASCMGRRALKQHIKQELIICQPKWQRKRKASLWMARQEKRKVIMLPTSLHLKNSVLILAFPFVTQKSGDRGENRQQCLCTCAVWQFTLELKTDLLVVLWKIFADFNWKNLNDWACPTNLNYIKITWVKAKHFFNID